MSAASYAISFGYGAQDGYWYGPHGVVGPFHKGNDRSTPVGVAIKIGNTTIGLTGRSGIVSGPHLHTQAGTDKFCQLTINPGPLEFQAGTVVHVGFANAWGHHVIIQVPGKGYICYAHLSQINVSVGQVISGSTEGGIAVETIKSMYWRLLGREADAGGIAHHSANVSSRGWDFVYNDIKNSAEGQRDWDRRNPTRVAELEARSSRLAVVEQQLKDLQSRPPEVVVKEVEKIVEVIKEVEKEVPVYTHDEETKNMIASIYNYFVGQYKTFQKYIKK